MTVSQWCHDLTEWQTDWAKMEGCEEQLARGMKMHQWITPNSIMAQPKDEQWWHRNWFYAMRLGLCSNRTCWALPTFHTPLVQNFSFCTELCLLETLNFIDSEIKCFLQFHHSWLAYKNKFLLWLTWATNLASYWSTLMFWERCAYYDDIKPGELFIFADGELFWVVKK